MTGEWGTTDKFYKAPNGRYFKDQDAYDRWLIGKEKKKPKKKKVTYKDIINKVYDLLQYEEGQPFPRIIGRRIKELNFYSYDVILKTFNECTPAIERAFRTKTFDSEIQRCNYMMAIISNHIVDVYRESQRAEQAIQEQTKETHVPEVLDVDISDIGRSEKGNNISNLLGGDDLWM